MFWYIWHALYKQQQGQEILETLLANISIDYVGLLVSISVPRKDYFFVVGELHATFSNIYLYIMFTHRFTRNSKISSAFASFASLKTVFPNQQNSLKQPSNLMYAAKFVCC